MLCDVNLELLEKSIVDFEIPKKLLHPFLKEIQSCKNMNMNKLRRICENLSNGIIVFNKIVEDFAVYIKDFAAINRLSIKYCAPYTLFPRIMLLANIRHLSIGDDRIVDDHVISSRFFNSVIRSMATLEDCIVHGLLDISGLNFHLPNLSLKIYLYSFYGISSISRINVKFLTLESNVFCNNLLSLVKLPLNIELKIEAKCILDHGLLIMKKRKYDKKLFNNL